MVVLKDLVPRFHLDLYIAISGPALSRAAAAPRQGIVDASGVWWLGYMARTGSRRLSTR